jgi:RND family efflux transporter MFP subunit
MRFVGRALSGVFLLALTLALFAWAGVTIQSAISDSMGQEPRSRPARERVFSVNVVVADPQTVTPVLSAFGAVESRRRLEVRARTGGAVVEISDAFEDGGRVEAGVLLFRVDPAQAQSALSRSLADKGVAEAEARDAARGLALAMDELAAARAQVDLRRQALTRQEDLKARGVVTDAAVETAALALSGAEQAVLSRRQAIAQAEARVDLAAANIARIEIDLADAERALSETELRAEFAGTLSDTNLVRGGVVSANERVATLIDADDLEVAFRVSTSQYARLLDDGGQLITAPVQISLDVFGTDLTTTGRITRESAAVGEGLTGRLLFARLENPRGFRSGDFVTVEVDEPPLRFVVRLPATAVSAGGAVLVLGEDDRLGELPVEVLRRQGDDVLVRSRALAGAQVVAERSPLIGAGIKVRAITPQAASAEPAGPAMVELSDERRARIVAFIEGNNRMPEAVKERLLAQMKEPMVPAQTVERIEARMGG